ncbi:MAG TPA: hypothetical protein VGO00_07095 [Kofleriaceae bacterium]|jgi:hypothetical protein|nr:hypothetical protein [Kofleriaceae bacterium]
MRARSLVVALGFVATASADPKPSAVDTKPFKDKMLVLQDSAGGTYIVVDGSDKRVFYGTGKIVYEQVVVGASRNGDAWSIDTLAPRIAGIKPAWIQFKDDHTYFKSCDGKDDAVLAQLTGDRAKTVVDKLQFMSTALVYRAHLLARDDTGVYYYVDKVAPQYGGNGYRVWVGKKGAMRLLPLVDVASDTAGEVFSTKSGDLRLIHDANDSSKQAPIWVKGEKRTTLIPLDVDANSPLIFRDLGVYAFTGTLCDNI